MKQQGTRSFLLDIRLFDSRLVGIMRRIQRVPKVQTRVRNAYCILGILDVVPVDIHVCCDIGTILQREIQAHGLTA